MEQEILIIGGGPAGCAAALFLARARHRVTLLHKGDTPLIKAFHWLLPGFPRGFGPGQWYENLHAELKDRGVQFLPEEVRQATLGASEKKLETVSGKIWTAPAILLASGCYDRKGFVEGEENFVGHGVFYNAYQDGIWFEGKTVLAEGKTDTAIREVLFLSGFAKKILFVVPAMKLEGDEKGIRELKKRANIEILLSASIKKILGGEKVEKTVVLTAGEERELEVDGVFLFARPSTPQYEFLKGTVEISEDGAVLVDDRFMTSIPGVFACGDMIAGVPQMPFVSAAQGLAAAAAVNRYLATPLP